MTRGPSPLQIISAAVAVHIQHLPAGVQTWNDQALQGFLIEFLRYDDYRGAFLSLSTSQWVSLFAIAAAGVLIIIRKRRAA